MNNLVYIIVEDNQPSSHIKQFLEGQGYELRFFENCDKLYEAYQHKKCILAIMDMDVSNSDNFAVCAKIRQTSSVPIILITSESSDENYIFENHIFGMSFGVDVYLKKPFSDITLLTYIRTLLEEVNSGRQYVNFAYRHNLFVQDF